MKTTVKVEGLRELDAALGELPKATARNTLVRVGKKRLQPIADRANQLAPDDPNTPGGLHTSFVVSTKLNKRQASMKRREIRKGITDKNFAEVHAGTNDPAGVQQEFGNQNHGPQPMLRPAWDEGKGGLLPGLGQDLWDEIEKSAKRLAARAARLANKASS